jgi:hypothetical protein
MLPDARTACLLHLAYMKVYAAAGKKHIMEFAEEMQAGTATLPDDLKPIGELLTTIYLQVITDSFAESFRLIAEQGLLEIYQRWGDQETTENKWRK